MPKLSIVIPVYYNAENLPPLYADLKEKILDKADFEVELLLVDDGSGDNSYAVMQDLARRDSRIRLFKLSRNFGSDAAVLCGLNNATGDCAVVKAADLQEPTEMLLDMYKSWQSGNNVVLAVREGREESRAQEFFADAYYAMTRKFALPNMPKKGFDVFLADRKVIEVLRRMDEPNSALNGQLLWSGFKTGVVTYVRRERKIGKSRWTLKKKIRLVADTLFSFSTLPVSIVTGLGAVSVLVSLVWALDALISKLTGRIDVTGWTMMFIFQLLSFGVIMLTLGLLGAYLWRTFDASRRRPPYLIEIADGQNETENGRKAA
ncbi:MAG: glycosyltransferase family 2 protein [Clostridiales bacterium]|nr:glycosyltransferase family 2 protein [Clostridiales bacterium]MDO4350165.1 glycosyltransferase family 2 protein [Eubacteriales bacterium]MDY4008325.1 glycosyltransferase family 2 protein [Candidatus Limiplasma sp.]